MTNRERMAKLAERIKAEVKRSAGKGVEAAARFLVARIKEELNVRPAGGLKRIRVGGKVAGYRAASKAIPFAPPRKITGALQRSVAMAMVGPSKALLGAPARSAKGFSYGKYHELAKSHEAWVASGRHPFIMPTARKHLLALLKIVGGAIRLTPGK